MEDSLMLLYSRNHLLQFHRHSASFTFVYYPDLWKFND